MSVSEQDGRRLNRPERTHAMSAIGVALGAVSMLPINRVAEQQRARTEAKQQAMISKRNKQRKVIEGLLKEKQRTKKEQMAVSSTIKTLSSRLSVFDQMLRDRPASPVSTDLDSFGSISTLELSDQEESETEGEKRGERVPAHSPQRFRHIYEEPKTPTLVEYEKYDAMVPRRSNVYHMRIDFFEQEEVKRFQGYHGFSQHDYGKKPIFLELLVPGQCTPFELINAILKAWKWENSHIYRFSSNTGKGLTRDPLPDQQRHYEAEAFTKHKNIPCLDAFCEKFSSVLIEYDICKEGNHWKWHGTIGEVESNSKLDHVVIQERGGHFPCQYAYQLIQRYIAPLEGSLIVKKGEGENEDGVIEEHRVHDVAGKYYKSTRDKLNHLLLQRYKDKDIKIRESPWWRMLKRLHHLHDTRMKSRGSGLSSGLAY